MPTSHVPKTSVSEIKLVARIEPILVAEGAVALLERISPTLENVDSSSGAIGTAVNDMSAELVPVIVAALSSCPPLQVWTALRHGITRDR